MQNITIRKQPGANYHRPMKSYDVERGGVTVGTLQTWGIGWDVLDAAMNQVSRHTTIKAAVRVASRVL